MSNFLEDVFRPSYSFDTISGFQTTLDTSLNGNVTIGNINTNYSLLLNGLPVGTGGYEWSENPAVQTVDMATNDLSNVKNIFDSTNTAGTPGQFLSTTITGVKWTTIPGANTANRVFVDRRNVGGGFGSVTPPYAYPTNVLVLYSDPVLIQLLKDWDTITVNVMTSVQTDNFDYCGIQWVCDDVSNNNLATASVQTSYIQPNKQGLQWLTSISLTFVLIKGVHYTNATTSLKLAAACTNGDAFWNTWQFGSSTVYTSDLVTNFIGGY
jgi:hypothetical protein